MGALTDELGGGRGKEAGLEAMGAANGSALRGLTGPGPAKGGGTVGAILWTGSFSIPGSVTLPYPGRGDFGEPLSRLLLVSEVLVLLLNLALRAFTSTLSSMIVCGDGLLMDKVLHVQQLVSIQADAAAATTAT